jgi:nucleotide sugar dehydrogenase
MLTDKPRMSVFGLGYVGTVTAACFAYKGFNVVAFDVDKGKVESLNQARSFIYEPELDEIIKQAVSSGSLKATYNPNYAIMNSDITFITVGTPQKVDGKIDLRYVEDASRMIGKALKDKDDWHLVVVKSTVIPGTTNNVVKKNIEEVSGKTCDREFGICFNPEFLREGAAVHDMFYPDRLIIGGSEKSSSYLLNLYNMFYGEKMPETIITNAENAELIKYANNAFLAMKVSFINMIARICQKIPKGDVEVVAKGIGLDKRIGSLFLKAGAGWGGSCWPKDLSALKKFAEEIGLELPLVDATIEINKTQPLILIDFAKELIGSLEGKRISILGLSFKPNTDDMREAVSIKIIESLLKEGAEVIAYDPKAMDNAKKIFGKKIIYANNSIECLKGADCAMIVTEWDEFKNLKPEDFINNMRNPALIDGRRIYDPKIFSSKLKFKAIGLGE